MTGGGAPPLFSEKDDIRDRLRTTGITNATQRQHRWHHRRQQLALPTPPNDDITVGDWEKEEERLCKEAALPIWRCRGPERTVVVYAATSTIVDCPMPQQADDGGDDDDDNVEICKEGESSSLSVNNVTAPELVAFLPKL